jgi:hypothetical protein
MGGSSLASPTTATGRALGQLSRRPFCCAGCDTAHGATRGVLGRRPPKGVVLGLDSSVSPTHGEPEMSVWNGHYECTCYHPQFVFNQFGDLERCALRPGNVHSADGWESVLKPVVMRYRGKLSRIYFRADAGFASPDVYGYLEGEGIKYAIRLPANRVLQERIGYLLKRPVGRPSSDARRSYANFIYQAGSWTKPPPRRRQGRVASGRAISPCRFHRDQHGEASRGRRRPLQQTGHMRTMDQRGQGRGQMDASFLSLLRRKRRPPSASCPAYNLGNFLRTLATPEPMKGWSLTSLKEKLIKIGAKVVSHGRYVAFQIAEVAVPRHLFIDILRLIAELRPPPVTLKA